MAWRSARTTYVMGRYGLSAWKMGNSVSMGNVPAAVVSCSISSTTAANFPGKPKSAITIWMAAQNTKLESIVSR